ncbi:MAG: hypothetical protein NT116_06230 [Candidatus Parcubacteria bacterium]|nr:hypothetical protein [Candidatus Parcubacteria bacterium]
MNKIKNVNKFARIFAVILLFVGIVYFLATIYLIIKYDVFINYFPALFEMIIESIAIVIYCFIGGIFLYRLKNWALYFVIIPALFLFFWEIFKIIFLFLYGYYEEISLLNGIFITKFIFGICSIYLFRNREYFNKNEKIQSTTT